MAWWRWKKEEVLSPLEGYNRWAASYHDESNPIKNLSDELVKKLLPDLSGKKFLDAGCGAGTFCSFAATQRATKIVGIDLSPAMIAEAKRHCPAGEFMSGDLSTTAIDEGQYNVVMCALVLAHIEQLQPALTKLIRALRPQGTLIITDFHPYLTLVKARRTFRDQSSGKIIEIRHYLHLLSEYIDIFAKTGVTLEILEEPMYNGTPVVFGLRARKTN